MQSPVTGPGVGPAPLPDVEHLVLYDGVCGLCDRFVQWLLRIDRDAELHFAPLQGSTAAALERAGLIPAGEDTVIYLTGLAGADPEVRVRSDAALAILGTVGAPWALFGGLRLVPRPLRDLVYRAVARSRYRIFGRFDACRVPDAATRARFLD